MLHISCENWFCRYVFVYVCECVHVCLCFISFHRRRISLFCKQSAYIYEYEVSGEFVIASVLSHHSKNLKRRMNQCYISVLLGKTKDSTPLRHRIGGPKSQEKRREVSILLVFPFHTFVSSSLSLPYVNWASQEGCLFHLRFSDLPWFYFCRLFLSLSFSLCHSGLLFPFITT